MTPYQLTASLRFERLCLLHGPQATLLKAAAFDQEASARHALLQTIELIDQATNPEKAFFWTPSGRRMALLKKSRHTFEIEIAEVVAFLMTLNLRLTCLRP